jgi:uncharacterized protein (TIGR00369 family)
VAPEGPSGAYPLGVDNQNLCLCQSTPVTSASILEHPLTETHIAKTSPQQNKVLVLERFDTLFNKRDYAAAERFWSDRYIQWDATTLRERQDHALRTG